MDSVLLYVVGVLVIVLGLGLSVGLHELGHYLPAKWFGVKVTRFMVGFGPTLFSRQRGETEFGVKAIPLGGYIAMIGMYPPKRPGDAPAEDSTSMLGKLADSARTASAETIGEGEEHRAFYRLPVWKRIVVMLGGPFMNFVLALVFYSVLIVGFGLPQTTSTIGTVNECMLPAGSSRDFCLAADPASPAAAAGLLPGDRVVSIAGTEVSEWAQVGPLIRAGGASAIEFVVERDGARRTLAVTPLIVDRYQTDAEGRAVIGADGSPVIERAPMVGITPLYQRAAGDVGAVLPAMGDNIAAVVNVIVNLPQRLVAITQAAFGAEERDPNGPISVVGVGRIAGEVASADWPVVDRVASMVAILASLNIALGVFNLIPLPPLDGGHVAAAGYEGIRRRIAKLLRRKDPGPVDAARLMPLTLTVAILLGAMSLLLIYADIVKPISLFG